MRPRRRIAIAAASALAAIIVIGATLQLTAPGDSGGARESVPSTASSTSPGGSTSTGRSTGSQVAPTSAAGGSPGTARAGETCSWQQEGSPATGPAGVVRCVRSGGDYLWVAAAG